MRYFAVLSMFTALITESAAGILMEDNRFLLVHQPMWQAMEEEMTYVSSLQIEVFQQMIPLVGGEFTAAGLRSDVLMSCHRAMAFCWREAFLQLEHYPLSLALGDVEANLRELLAKPLADITDPTALQFREALEEGWSIDAAAEHLEFLREAGATTDLVEQSHAFGRSTLLSHTELGQVQLQARSLVMQCHAAFSLDAAQAQVQQLQQKIAVLEAKLDKRFDGSDLFRRKHCQAAVFPVFCSFLKEFDFCRPFGSNIFHHAFFSVYHCLL